MVNLEIKIADITLKNPIIIGAGTPTLNATNMEKCFKAGAAGVIVKTIAYAKLHQLQPRPRFHVIYPHAIIKGEYFSLYSVELMAPYTPEKWVKELRKASKAAKKYQAVLIASIAGRSIDEWEKLAKMVENAEADMIEINISCPHIESEEKVAMGKVAGAKPRLAEELTRVVKDTVSIPVLAKLTPHGANPLDITKAVIRGGANAVVATARFQGVIIDINSMRPILWGGMGGYGGPWMVPISCSWVIKLFNEKIGVPIIDPQKCDGCRLCVAICPLGAISFKKLIISNHESPYKTPCHSFNYTYSPKDRNPVN